MRRSEPSAFEYFKHTLTQRYADFNGRSRRSEYWYFVLFQIVTMIPLYLIGIIGMASESLAVGFTGMGLYLIAAFGFFIPSLAVAVRRLHDTGRSGWYYLIAFIPLVGGIILIVFLVEDSHPNDNQWGPNPKVGRDEIIDHLG